MNSLELCAGAGWQAQGLERSGFQHEALKIPFGWDGLAVKDLDVEIGQFAPIARDQIGVDVFCLDGHSTIVPGKWAFAG